MKRIFFLVSFVAILIFSYPTTALACEPPPPPEDCQVEVTNTVEEVTTDAACEWTVEKTVEEVTTEESTGESTEESSDVSLDMTEGESAELDYTIDVDKEDPATANYTFSGDVVVENDHPIIPIWVKGVDVTVGGQLSDDSWEEIGTIDVKPDSQPGDKIEDGSSKTYPYSQTYTLEYGKYNNFGSTADVKIGWLKWGPGIFLNSDNSDVVAAPEAVNQELVVTDTETINPDNGGVTYEITGGPTPAPDAPPVVSDGTTTMSWTLSSDTTITYKKTVTGNKAGEYVLTNGVTTDNPDVPEVGTEVDIIVTTPPPTPPTTGGEEGQYVPTTVPTPTVVETGAKGEVPVVSEVAGPMEELPFTGGYEVIYTLFGLGTILGGISLLVASKRRK